MESKFLLYSKEEIQPDKLISLPASTQVAISLDALDLGEACIFCGTTSITTVMGKMYKMGAFDKYKGMNVCH